MDCEKHKRIVEKYNGTLDELANDIGDLHYESLETLFALISDKLERDAKKDLSNKRVKLSAELFGSSEYIKLSSVYIGEAWRISKPYMK